MPVIFKWILFGCMSRSVFTMSVLLAIYVVIESFDKARHLGHGFTSNLMIEYILLKIPFMVSEFMPIIMLIGASVYLIELSRHHEVVSIRAAGLGINKILIPLLTVAMLAASLSFIIGEWVTPTTNQRLDNIERVYIQHKVSNNKEIQWLKDGHRFFRLKPLNADYFAFTMLETDPSGNWMRRIDSSKASYQQGSWQLHDVNITNPSEHQAMQMQHLNTYTIASPSGPETAELPKARYMQAIPLYHYIQQLEHAGLSNNAYIYALHKKFAAPLSCLLMVILAAALCLHTGDRNSRASWGLILTITLGLFYYIVGNASYLLANSEHLPAAFAAWLPSLVFGGLAMFLLLKNEGH